MRRALLDAVIEDLKTKMVFVSGPRQVGKTTLGRQVLEALQVPGPVYLNWDRPEHRRIMRELAWSRAAPVAVLDEIHKHPRWKSLLKGFYDTEGERQRLLVTGSARLDFYRRGGDSLVGRYHGHRLHPLSVGELGRDGRPPAAGMLATAERWPRGAPVSPAVLDGLLQLGGFPEPLLGGSDRKARRWRVARREQVLHEDLRDLSNVRHVALIEQLVDLLAERVGSPISINALRQDLGVDHKTVTAWIDVLERLYMVFRVRPWAGSLARTLRKEPKIYFWDWAEAPEGGPRFENLVASHLLKLCHHLTDVEGWRAELCYVRDREKREVDFLVGRDRKPWILAEAKQADTRASPALAYFQGRLRVPHAVQVVLTGEPRRGVVPAAQWLAAMP
jgi:predicted AAA+ superfamily ATPase